jgi:hypothetical protein
MAGILMVKATNFEKEHSPSHEFDPCLRPSIFYTQLCKKLLHFFMYIFFHTIHKSIYISIKIHKILIQKGTSLNSCGNPFQELLKGLYRGYKESITASQSSSSETWSSKFAKLRSPAYYSLLWLQGKDCGVIATRKVFKRLVLLWFEGISKQIQHLYSPFYFPTFESHPFPPSSQSSRPSTSLLGFFGTSSEGNFPSEYSATHLFLHNPIAVWFV